MQADDIAASKIRVAQWDGFENPSPIIFNYSVLGPDGKIYIASRGTTYNLHVINHPDCPGLLCNVEQHAITLPVTNFISIPNFPSYRNEPSNVNCDSIVNAVDIIQPPTYLTAYPNPSRSIVSFRYQLPSNTNTGVLRIRSMTGRTVFKKQIHQAFGTLEWNPNQFPSGVYIYELLDQNNRHRCG